MKKLKLFKEWNKTRWITFIGLILLFPIRTVNWVPMGGLSHAFYPQISYHPFFYFSLNSIFYLVKYSLFEKVEYLLLLFNIGYLLFWVLLSFSISYWLSKPLSKIIDTVIKRFKK